MIQNIQPHIAADYVTTNICYVYCSTIIPRDRFKVNAEIDFVEFIHYFIHYLLSANTAYQQDRKKAAFSFDLVDERHCLYLL